MITGILQHQGLKLDGVPDLVGPCRLYGTLNGQCTGIAYDSRHLQPGMIFTAIPGLRADGAAFADAAIDRGAVAILGRGPDLDHRRVPYIEVEHPRQAMADVAAAFYGYPTQRLKTVGITGTNGKTTVSFLTRDILRAAGLQPGLIGTLHYEIGDRRIPAGRTTPESPDLQLMFAEMLRARCESVTLEVSSHALAQERVRGIEFDVSVFTNLTQDHLDYHKSIDNYFSVKSRLFLRGAFAGKATRMVINIDDTWGRKLALRTGSGDLLITYGTRPEARVRAENIVPDAEGVQFKLFTPWGVRSMRIGLLGRFSLSNALAAVAAGGALGLDLDMIVLALEHAQPVPGRMEPIPNSRDLHVFVDYAHTEDALESVLKGLREVVDGRLICVFGCGGDRDRTKRPHMGSVSSRWSDVTVITSDNSRSENPVAIMEEIAAGCASGGDVLKIVDRREAIAEALSQARPGDTVLVAGKGHESLQEADGQVFRFDDREVLHELLEAMGGTNSVR